jgi:hypothetical protein
LARSAPSSALACFILAVALAAPSSIAFAADPKAESLAKEAYALAEAGKWADACPKYAESLKLEQSYGVQYSLAECYEKTGKLGSALFHYRRVEEAPKAANKQALSLKAHDRIAAIEPQVSKVKVVLPAGITPKDVVVKIDGNKIAPENFSEMPIDTGEHNVEVSQAGKKPWTDTIHVQIGTYPIEVPELTSAKEEAAKPITTTTTVPLGQSRANPTYRIVGGVAVGVGVVGVVVGSIFGLSARSKRDEAREICRANDAKQCHNEAGLDVWRDASSAGTISTVGFILGPALIATGVVLWVIAPTTPVLTGSVDPNGRGGTIGLRGVF